MMAHTHKIEAVSFTGKSTSAMSDAIVGARTALDAWYAGQEILAYPDGRSIFQFSTAAYETMNEHVFIITVFDARLKIELS